ncbi:MAG: amidohydrolase family protein [Candidatus Dormibacteria bacterium]
MTRAPSTDVHCHLLPPELRGAGAASWRDPWFASCHAPGEFASGSEVVRAIDAAGLERALVFGWPFADPGLLAEVNEYVAQEASASSGRLVGLALINPARRGWEAELDRCRSLGLVGVGELNADAQGFDLAFEGGLAAAIHTLEEMSWPWILHASEPVGHGYPGKGSARPERLWKLLQPALVAAPRTRLCLAHLGGGLPFYAHMPEVAELCRRLWFDTAALPYLYRGEALQTVEQLLGPGRICFGSDYPLLAPNRYRELIPQDQGPTPDWLYRQAPSAWLGGANGPGRGGSTP